MPAFQLSQQSPAALLHLCGVKRRPESSVEGDHHLCDPCCDQYPSPKRICLLTDGSFNRDFDNVLPLNENDQQERSCNIGNYASQPAIMLGTNNGGVTSKDMQPMPQRDSLPRAVTTESQMTMDSMDVDYNVVVTERHHVTPYVGQTSSAQEVQVAEIDRQFCEDHCGLGSVSPASGLLRCYCRPSWEGMVEMQPYRSDYY